MPGEFNLFDKNFRKMTERSDINNYKRVCISNLITKLLRKNLHHSEKQFKLSEKPLVL